MFKDKDTGEDLESQPYGEFEHAIKDVSFQFSESEKVAIIGRVGSGKTSLLLTMMKELKIIKGNVQVNTNIVSYCD